MGRDGAECPIPTLWNSSDRGVDRPAHEREVDVEDVRRVHRPVVRAGGVDELVMQHAQAQPVLLEELVGEKPTCDLRALVGREHVVEDDDAAVERVVVLGLRHRGLSNRLGEGRCERLESDLLGNNNSHSILRGVFHRNDCSEGIIP